MRVLAEGKVQLLNVFAGRFVPGVFMGRCSAPDRATTVIYSFSFFSNLVKKWWSRKELETWKQKSLWLLRKQKCVPDVLSLSHFKECFGRYLIRDELISFQTKCCCGKNIWEGFCGEMFSVPLIARNWWANCVIVKLYWNVLCRFRLSCLPCFSLLPLVYFNLFLSFSLAFERSNTCDTEHFKPKLVPLLGFE